MFSVCYVTVPSAQVGKAIANKLVTNKLAACVNMIPGVTSFYEWQGKMEEDNELLLMIKTQTSLVPEVITAVKATHTYDVPEVISVPMGEGSKDYLEWVEKMTTKLPLQAGAAATETKPTSYMVWKTTQLRS